jgi:hypothetical protein
MKFSTGIFSMKNAGYVLIIISWMLILTGIIYEIVIPYDKIISQPVEHQSKKFMISLGNLYWFFIPAAIAGFTGGMLVHKHKEKNI